MAHHKSAKKQIRQSRKHRIANRYNGKTTRNAVKKLRSATTKAEAQKMLPEVFSLVDKLAKRNVIHKNKASNLKSKIQKRVNSLA